MIEDEYHSTKVAKSRLANTIKLAHLGRKRAVTSSEDIKKPKLPKRKKEDIKPKLTAYERKKIKKQSDEPMIE